MITFFVGIVLAALTLFLFLRAGGSEPTSHGRAVVGQIGIIAAIVVAVVSWLIGFLIWLF